MDYSNQFSRFHLTPKQAIRGALLLLVILGVVLSVRFIATHGIIRVTKPSKEASYTVYALNNTTTDDPVTSSASFQIVAAGDYNVELKNDASLQQKNITVSPWFGSTKVDFSALAQKKVERIAGETLGNIIQSESGQLISFSTTSDSTDTKFIYDHNEPSGNAVTIEPVRPTSSFGKVSNGHLISFENDSEAIHTYVFDTSLTNASVLPDSSNGTIPGIITSSVASDNHFGIISQSNSAFLKVYNGTDFVQNIYDASKVSKGSNGYPLAAVSGQVAAIGFGENSQAIEGDENQASDTTATTDIRDFIIKIYSLETGKVTHIINLGKVTTISGFSVSSDGSRLAVMNDRRLEIYNTNTYKRIFSFNGSTFKSPLWIGNDRLIFSDQLNGIIAYDALSRSARSLIAPGVLTLDQFTVYNNKILFTATSERNSQTTHPPTDAYSLSLTTDTTDSNALITKLPYEDNDIKIKTLNNVIYASPNFYKRSSDINTSVGFYATDVDQATKQKVTDYLQKNVSGYKNYALVYGYNL